MHCGAAISPAVRLEIATCEVAINVRKYAGEEEQVMILSCGAVDQVRPVEYSHINYEGRGERCRGTYGVAGRTQNMDCNRKI